MHTKALVCSAATCRTLSGNAERECSGMPREHNRNYQGTAACSHREVSLLCKEGRSSLCIGRNEDALFYTPIYKYIHAYRCKGAMK